MVNVSQGPASPARTLVKTKAAAKYTQDEPCTQLKSQDDSLSNTNHGTSHPPFQYICENHFQRLSRRSLFTGLKAANHFGRPDMVSFLKFVQRKHSYVSKYMNNCRL